MCRRRKPQDSTDRRSFSEDAADSSLKEFQREVEGDLPLSSRPSDIFATRYESAVSVLSCPLLTTS